MVSEECFYYKSMGENHPNLEPRGVVGRIYIGYYWVSQIIFSFYIFYFKSLGENHTTVQPIWNPEAWLAEFTYGTTGSHRKIFKFYIFNYMSMGENHPKVQPFWNPVAWLAGFTLRTTSAVY